MSTADTVLRRVALVLSVVLVLLLTALALVSVFGADDLGDSAQGEVSPLDDVDTDDNPDDDTDDGDESADGDDEPQDPASATALYPGDGIRIGSDDAPLSLSCRSTIGSDREYVVLADNLGATSRDFLVAVELVGADGQRVEAVARAADLLPNESRPLTLEPSGQIDSVERCVITAVQSDRQIILTGQ